MEQKTKIDWQQVAIKEHALRKQTIHKAKQLLCKTTGYAKYLEQQNYAFEEKNSQNNEKLQKAMQLIKQLQRLASKQKDELLALQNHKQQLFAQIEQQTIMLRSEIAEHTQTELALGETKIQLQEALTAHSKTVIDNNWQEFFVFKPTDAALQ